MVGMTPIEWLTAALVLVTLLYVYYTMRITNITNKNLERIQLNKEMDCLIMPLKEIYNKYFEHDSEEKFSRFWRMYLFRDFHVQHTPNNEDLYDAKEVQRLIETIEKYKYLGPSDLRLKVDDFLLHLREMKRSTDYNFQRGLRDASKGLFGVKDDVKGGVVEWRYYEICEELDKLDRNFWQKMKDFFKHLKSKIRQQEKGWKL